MSLGLQCPLGFRMARAEPPKSGALKPRAYSLMVDTVLDAFHITASMNWAKQIWGDATLVLLGSSVKIRLDCQSPSPLTTCCAKKTFSDV